MPFDGPELDDDPDDDGGFPSWSIALLCAALAFIVAAAAACSLFRWLGLT